jgi:hypothetical protein
MNNLEENPMPSIAELGGELLLGSGFEAEPPDSESSVERTQPTEEVLR